MTGRLLLLALLLAFAAPAAAAPPIALDAGGSSRLELVPDWDGAARVRAAHSFRLGLEVGPRWRVDLHAGARFGGALYADAAADLYRATVRYMAPSVDLTLGRLMEPGSTGRLLLDGAVLHVGHPRDLLGFKVWVGHSWHPEAAWDASREVTGGGELRLRPRRPSGSAGPVVAALGGSLRGNGDLPTGRAWINADGIDVRGGSWGAGVETAFAEDLGWDGEPPLRAFGRLSGPLGRHVDLGVEVRYEGLPPIGVPLGLPGPMELLSPDGYGVARGHLNVRAGKLHLSLQGGPTLQPAEADVLRTGGLARLSATAQVNRVLRVGGLVIGAGFASSWVAGGGANAGVEVGPLHATVSGTVLRHRGLDHAALWVGEGRGRAGVLLPLPGGVMLPRIRIYGEVAGGADRLLEGWVRGGVGVDIGVQGRTEPKEDAS